MTCKGALCHKALPPLQPAPPLLFSFTPLLSPSASPPKGLHSALASPLPLHTLTFVPPPGPPFLDHPLLFVISPSASVHARALITPGHWHLFFLLNYGKIYIIQNLPSFPFLSIQSSRVKCIVGQPVLQNWYFVPIKHQLSLFLSLGNHHSPFCFCELDCYRNFIWWSRTVFVFFGLAYFI